MVARILNHPVIAGLIVAAIVPLITYAVSVVFIDGDRDFLGFLGLKQKEAYEVASGETREIYSETLAGLPKEFGRFVMGENSRLIIASDVGDLAWEIDKAFFADGAAIQVKHEMRDAGISGHAGTGGGHCHHGAPGGDGKPGKPGGSSASVDLAIRDLKKEGTFTIDVSGGAGGAGGAGGRGGNGGRAKRSSSCNAGNGGAGGVGGRGGDGGHGGNVTIRLKDYRGDGFPPKGWTVNAAGGAGGKGGPGGLSGAAGEARCWELRVAFKVGKTCLNEGSSGRGGSKGADGKPGADGLVVFKAL